MTHTERSAPVSPWAPFRRRAFFWLWLGVVVSSVGAWAQTVGAQWLLVSGPDGATLVTLVQTASTLPMMLLALPAGVLADAFDRRWLMFGVQIYFIVVAVLLAVLTAAGLMPPALLLTFTFAVGAGQAMLSPTWQALITELVPREELPAATRLDMVSVNVARAAGPAIAGVVIARWGVPPVFVMTAAAGGFLAVVLVVSRRPRVPRGEREPFLPALVAGGRYVRHEPTVRRMLFRLATFMAPACAVWALLPLIASRQLGLAADGYGLLFAALGLGAVIGAVSLGRVKQHLSSNGVSGSGRLLFRRGVRIPGAGVEPLVCHAAARRLWLRLDRLRLHHHFRVAVVPARLGACQGDCHLPDGFPWRAGHRGPDLGTRHSALGPWRRSSSSSRSRRPQCGRWAGAASARQSTPGSHTRRVLGSGHGSPGAATGRRAHRGLRRVRGTRRPGGRVPGRHGLPSPISHCGAAHRAGNCSGSEKAPACSLSSSRYPPGRNTNCNTMDD